MVVRIAVPLSEPDFNAKISEHFGRTRYFALVDVNGDSIVNVEIVRIPFDEHGPGDLPNFLREHDVNVVLAYGMGRKAIAHFHALGIEVVTGVAGNARKAVEDFIKQTLKTDPYWRERIEATKHK